MSSVPVGVLPVVAYVATAGLSLPLTAVAFAIGRLSGSPIRGVVYTGLTVTAALTAAVLSFAVVSSPTAALAAFASLAGAAAFLAVLPVWIGRGIVLRYTDCSEETALQYAVAGWSPALLASLALFLGLGGGVDTGIVAFLTDQPPVVPVAFAAIVAFGPGVAGVSLARSFGSG